MNDESRRGDVDALGPHELVEEPNVGGGWLEIAARRCVRYLGENGPRYLEPTLDKPRWSFRLEPTSFTSWQGQDWAARYR
ncbi:MAG: hypothetical protein ACRDO7_03730 [Nocardioidaceae bacterium]